jgi:polyisoprenyl-phosphate glycosyltransferase
MLSLVIPVYRNEANLPRLLDALAALHAQIPALEVVFVIDASPDRSAEILAQRLPLASFPSQLVSLSRNFGSFSAILAGLQHARGSRFAVMAADLQEPPDLIVQFDGILAQDRADVVFGVRSSRHDSWPSVFASNLFWSLYRRFVVPDMPPGGVDIFACSLPVRDRLLDLHESHTNLIALLLWLGFRRQFVTYQRLPRLEGESSWTFAKKLRYSFDSIFNFTDLPVQFLLATGTLGTLAALAGSLIVLFAWLTGRIVVLGYTPVILAVMFFGGLTTLGLGILGQYLWLTLRNTRRRPNFIAQSVSRFGP